MAISSRLLERELKFSAEPALPLPDLRNLVETTRLPQQHLQAAYFDTADLRLWRQGITLRHRVGEGPEAGMWTLKLPSDSAGDALERTELSWPGTRASVPAEVTAILKGLLRHAELRQLFVLSTTRQRMVLHDRGGDRLGELDDDLVTVEGGPNDGMRFRQLELELAEDVYGAGQAKTTEAVAKALTAAGAHLGDGAKFAKALGDEATTAQSKRALTKRARMGDVVRASTEDGLGRLLAHDYLLRLERAEPRAHDVHQARVASRRLRSDLKTLRAVVDPVWNDHMREDLRWLGNLLGEVRDLDVLRKQIESHRPEGADAGPRELDTVLSAQRRRAVTALNEGLDSDRYLRLLDRLDAASAAPPLLANAPRGHFVVHPGQRARRSLPHVVHVPWRSLRKRVRKAGRTPTDKQLHKIRIGAKQLRYACELASPVEGKRARRAARRAERLQTVLGEHHDAVFAEAWLRTEFTRLTPAGTLDAGRLIEVQRQRQADLRREWPRQWRALAKKKVRRWLKR
jgi:CHAD domain-containing protein